MKKLLLLSAIFIEMLFPLSGNCYAASSDQQVDGKQIYELRERCRSSAEDFFKIIYNGINKETTGVSFKNHYNVRLNKCFVILDMDNNDEDGYFSVKEFFDFNDCFLLGTFRRDKHNNEVHSCYVLDMNCQSEAEWDAFVKSYMEE